MTKKINFKSGGPFGGDMTALEFKYKGFQILVSDTFGEEPKEGNDWSLGVYKKDSLGEYDDNPLLTFTGKKYCLDKAKKKAAQFFKKKGFILS